MDGWAEAYKLLYGPGGAGVFDIGDVSSYRRLAEETTGGVLELGCGTGRITIPILETGADACAVDASVSQLKLLATEATARGLDPNIIIGDA